MDIENLMKEFKIDMFDNAMAPEVFDMFPYEIEIFTLDGVGVYINKKCVKKVTLPILVKLLDIIMF